MMRCDKGCFAMDECLGGAARVPMEELVPHQEWRAGGWMDGWMEEILGPSRGKEELWDTAWDGSRDAAEACDGG